MTIRGLSAVLVIGCALCSAQVAPRVHSDDRAPTLEEQLQSRGIALTKESLLAALHNSSPDIRSQAALKLSQDRTADAIPGITTALSREQVPHTKVAMAFALAQLGSEVGQRSLKTMCESNEFTASTRMEAARLMLLLHNQGCFKSVLDVLQSQSEADAGARSEALYLVPQFSNLSRDDSATEVKVIGRLLNDPSVSVRIAASDVLGTLGDRAAIPFFRSAITAEQDEDVLSQMQKDLEKLQKEK